MAYTTFIESCLPLYSQKSLLLPHELGRFRCEGDGEEAGERSVIQPSTVTVLQPY